MLGLLRKKKTAKRILWVLAAVIIPVFAFWGIGGAIRSSKTEYAATAWGEKIPGKQFSDCYEAVKTQAVLMYGEKFNQVAKFLNLKEQTFKRLLLLKEAEKKNIKAYDQEVVNFIHAYPLFLRGNQFSNELYARILVSGLRISPRKFEEQIRNTIKIQKLNNAITANIQVSEEELKETFIKANTEYKINYVKFPIEGLDKIRQQSEFNENTLKDIEKAAKEKPEQLQKAISNSQEKNLTKSATLLGYEVKESDYFTMDSYIKELGYTYNFAHDCKELEKGEMGDIIRTQDAYFVFALKETRMPDEKTYEEQKQDFRQKLVESRKNSIFQEYIMKLLKEANLKENSLFFEKYKFQ